ncbi:MAG TPA: hypothetical protein PK583_03380 [Gammaproteobacteria bacterium]|nr:hypothetical protein [Nitrosomonas sp.]HQW57977.1 hypothetical protein [Gammaproteobacteria bacterium]
MNLPVSAPKIAKKVDKKSTTVLKNGFLKSYGALRTFMQNNPINNALKKKREASNKKMLSNPDDPQSLSIHNSI